MKWNLNLFLLLICFCNVSLASITSTTLPRVWASTEYLYWWPQNSPINVPLVTQSNNPSSFAIINEPGTQIIFGSGSNNNSFNLSGMSGGRITVGGWVNESDRFGIEGSGFGLTETKSTFSASSVNGAIPALNIPFFDTQNSTESVLVAGHPNTVTVSDSFQPWGIELNGLFNLSNQAHFPLMLFTGLRYINFSEKFMLNDAIYDLPSFPNSVVNLRDNFSTRNNFYGLQVGTRTNFIYHKFIFDVSTSLTLGENFQKLIINGQLNENNQTILQSIGLFAEPSNIGSFTQHQFAVVPELRVKVAYDFNKYIRPFMAYNFLYINNIIRPAEQIDRNINKSQNPALGGTGILSGPATPSPQFNSSGMWIQGLSVGITITF